jgi:sulfite exporter TauE/SafE
MGGDLALLFMASFLGSAHCIGMCGPYVALCTAQFVPRGASRAARFGLRVLFNLGRVASYCVIGMIAGAFGQIAMAMASRWHMGGTVALAAGFATLVFGLSMMGLIQDPAGILARAGMDHWLRAARMKLSESSPLTAPLFLGALQGWLPCALVYAAASRAAVAGSASAGALTMAVFGLGTLPAVFALTVIPQQVLRRVKAQRLAGALLCAVGILLILRGLAGYGLIASTGWW